MSDTLDFLGKIQIALWSVDASLRTAQNNQNMNDHKQTIQMVENCTSYIKVSRSPCSCHQNVNISKILDISPCEAWKVTNLKEVQITINLPSTSSLIFEQD